jgi:hypothetical protein
MLHVVADAGADGAAGDEHYADPEVDSDEQPSCDGCLHEQQVACAEGVPLGRRSGSKVVATASRMCIWGVAEEGKRCHISVLLAVEGNRHAGRGNTSLCGMCLYIIQIHPQVWHSDEKMGGAQSSLRYHVMYVINSHVWLCFFFLACTIIFTMVVQY